MAIYVTRTGTATAKQTNTGMTAQGSITAPGGINVPTGTSQLIGIIAAVSGTSNAVGNATVFLRISGQGIGGGEQDVTVGGVGFSLLTSGGAAGQAGPVYIPTQIPVTAGAGVTLNFDTDTGGTFVTRLDVCATLVFA